MPTPNLQAFARLVLDGLGGVSLTQFQGIEPGGIEIYSDGPGTDTAIHLQLQQQYHGLENSAFCQIVYADNPQQVTVQSTSDGSAVRVSFPDLGAAELYVMILYSRTGEPVRATAQPLGSEPGGPYLPTNPITGTVVVGGTPHIVAAAAVVGASALASASDHQHASPVVWDAPAVGGILAASNIRANRIANVGTVRSAGVGITQFGSDTSGAALGAQGDYCTIAGGDANGVDSTSAYAFVGGGTSNIVLTATCGFIGAGQSNTVSGASSGVLCGFNNLVAAATSGILAGVGGTIEAACTSSAIVNGSNTFIKTDPAPAGKQNYTSSLAFIASSSMATITGSDWGTIVGSDGSTITGSVQSGVYSSGAASLAGSGFPASTISGPGLSPLFSFFSFDQNVFGGYGHTVAGDASYANTVVGGANNKCGIAGAGGFTNFLAYNVLLGGNLSWIKKGTANILGAYSSTMGATALTCDYNVCIGGSSHLLATTASCTTSAIVGGTSNAIQGATNCTITGGANNTITNATNAHISAGSNNTIGSGATAACILGGIGGSATMQTQNVFAGGYTASVGERQRYELVLRGDTPGSVAGESVILKFGGVGVVPTQEITLVNGKSYSIKVFANVTQSGAANVATSAEIEFSARAYCTGGVVTVASGIVSTVPAVLPGGLLGATLALSGTGTTLRLTAAIAGGTTLASKWTVDLIVVETLA